ncbi:MAG TPA: hypothetical protein DGG95_00035 [Cytophagales bacterium]|jgi:hypothetical protein|nr:hypothetical protein [Cytophagales bacterium]
MNRRGFVLLGAGTVAAVAFPSYYFFRRIEYDPSLSIPKSLAMIWEKEEIKSIGKKYIIKSDEDSERSLVKSIMSGHDGEQSYDKFIEQKVKQDFQSGNTITVDGWVLSVTEARQCALHSIGKS